MGIFGEITAAGDRLDLWPLSPTRRSWGGAEGSDSDHVVGSSGDQPPSSDLTDLPYVRIAQPHHPILVGSLGSGSLVPSSLPCKGREGGRWLDGRGRGRPGQVCGQHGSAEAGGAPRWGEEGQNLACEQGGWEGTVAKGSS